MLCECGGLTSDVEPAAVVGVGYCRPMSNVVGLLLVAMNRNEENSFWILAGLVEDTLYPGTYSRNLEGCQVRWPCVIPRDLLTQPGGLPGEVAWCDASQVARCVRLYVHAYVCECVPMYVNQGSTLRPESGLFKFFFADGSESG